jgi:hypothetical protein
MNPIHISLNLPQNSYLKTNIVIQKKCHMTLWPIISTYITFGDNSAPSAQNVIYYLIVAFLGKNHASSLLRYNPKSQFHQNFAQNFFPIFWHQKIAKPIVIREKLLNALLYEKCVCKMLMKLTPEGKR